MQRSEFGGVVTVATVLENREVGPACFQMRLADRNVAANARPGQFVHVRIPSPSLDPLLRRPLSVCLTNPTEGAFLVLYQVVGRGTQMLEGLRSGDRLDVLGPLGRGFELPSGPGTVALVAGGMGIAPLVMLSHQLVAAGRQFTLVAGACNRDLLVGLDLLPAALHLVEQGPTCEQNRSVVDPKAWRSSEACKPHSGKRGPLRCGGRSGRPAVFRGGDEALRPVCWIEVATEDGSFGRRGLVTDLLGPLLRERDFGCVYACGPRAMLREVARLGEACGVPVQVSLEERVACGLGACLGCAVKRRSHGGGGPEHPTYLRVCADGPVFWASEVDLDDIP